jgi:hypothetical protein
MGDDKPAPRYDESDAQWAERRRLVRGGVPTTPITVTATVTNAPAHDDRVNAARYAPLAIRHSPCEYTKIDVDLAIPSGDTTRYVITWNGTDITDRLRDAVALAIGVRVKSLRALSFKESATTGIIVEVDGGARFAVDFANDASVSDKPVSGWWLMSEDEFIEYVAAVVDAKFRMSTSSAP